MTEVDYNRLFKAFKEGSIGSVLDEYDLTFDDAFKLCLKGAVNRNFKKSEEIDRKYIDEKNDYFYVKKYRNRRMIYFGKFKTLDDAVSVRDKLIDCNWKITKVKSICKELGITNFLMRRR